MDSVIAHRYAVLAEFDKCASRAISGQPLDSSKEAETIRAMRQQLAAVWSRTDAPKEQLVGQLEDWCVRTERSDIAAVQAFSRRLRTYA